MSKLDMHLYESAAQISEIGAGLSIWQRVYDILVDLGLESDMQKYLENAETACEPPLLVSISNTIFKPFSLHFPEERPA